MKVHPIPRAIFETIRSGFIQILHCCSVSWKIPSSVFFSSNLKSFGQKKSMEVKFFNFWVVGWKFTKFLMSYLKPQVSFSLNFTSFFNVMRDNTSVFFKLKLYIWFLQKKPIKVQNFWLSTAQVKFHQIYTLIGFFCWKYIQFQLKKYRGVMSHDTEEWCKIWRKTDLLFQKWIRIWRI